MTRANPLLLFAIAGAAGLAFTQPSIGRALMFVAGVALLTWAMLRLFERGEHPPPPPPCTPTSTVRPAGRLEHRPTRRGPRDQHCYATRADRLAQHHRHHTARRPVDG